MALVPARIATMNHLAIENTSIPRNTMMALSRFHRCITVNLGVGMDAFRARAKMEHSMRGSSTCRPMAFVGWFGSFCGRSRLPLAELASVATIYRTPDPTICRQDAIGTSSNSIYSFEATIVGFDRIISNLSKNTATARTMETNSAYGAFIAIYVGSFYTSIIVRGPKKTMAFR